MGLRHHAEQYRV